MAKPRPRDAPVTRATRPSRRNRPDMLALRRAARPGHLSGSRTRTGHRAARALGDQGGWAPSRGAAATARRARLGPPLVFLHEGLGYIAMWKDFPSLAIASASPGRRLRPVGPRAVRAARPRPRAPLLARRGADLPAGGAARAGRRAANPDRAQRRRTIAPSCSRGFPAFRCGVVTEAAHVFVEETTLAGIRAAGAAYAQPPISRPGSPATTARRPTACSAPGTTPGSHRSSGTGTSRRSCRGSPAPWCSRGPGRVRDRGPSVGDRPGRGGPGRDRAAVWLAHVPHPSVATRCWSGSPRFLERHLAGEIGR